MKHAFRLLATSACVATLLSACGSKDATTAETTSTSTSETASTTPAVTTETTPAATPVTETVSTTEAAAFDINSVPVSNVTLGAFPYLTSLQGYRTRYDSDSTGFDFDRVYIYDGKNIVPVEGKVVFRQFRPVDSKKAASELMILRNYENLVKNLGGVKVYSGEIDKDVLKKFGEAEYDKHSGSLRSYFSTDTYVIRQKDKEVWVQVQAHDNDYRLSVVERAAMPQQASVMPATELKKN
ncbi:hypothetical protein GCM10027346_35520 [Hymenobacter seoulensis]